MRDRLTEILKNADHCVYVVTDNENIMGWIHGCYSLRVESDPFVEIGGLVVDENYRKQGLGKMLVEKIKEWSKSKETLQIRVRCNTLRKASHAFYNSIGFIEKKEQKIFDIQSV